MELKTYLAVGCARSARLCEILFRKVHQAGSTVIRTTDGQGRDARILEQWLRSRETLPQQIDRSAVRNGSHADNRCWFVRVFGIGNVGPDAGLEVLVRVVELIIDLLQIRQATERYIFEAGPDSRCPFL